MRRSHEVCVGGGLPEGERDRAGINRTLARGLRAPGSHFSEIENCHIAMLCGSPATKFHGVIWTVRVSAISYG